MFPKASGKTALIYNDKEISYDEFILNTKKYASIVKSINPQERVVIFAENRPEWVYAFYTSWINSCIAVPVDYLSTPEETAYILKDCKPSHVFTSKGNLEKLLKAFELTGKKIPYTVFEEVNEASLTPVNKEFIYDQESIAVIIYTSGTTGGQKGVMLSYGNLKSNVDVVTKDIYRESDRIIPILPLHHIFPLQGTLTAPLYMGATLIFLQQVSSEEIIKNLQKYKVTIILGVPRLFNLFHGGIMQKINANKIIKTLFNISKSLNSYSAGQKIFKKVQDTFGGQMRFFISGGAKLDPVVARDFKALGFRILEGYGMTEASPIITFPPLNKKLKIGSVGQVMPGIKIKFEDGVILASGPNIMKGYYNRPEETAQVLENGWLKTGDIGHIDKQGYLYLTGRKKEIIVLPNGKNLNPEEIESKLMKDNPIIKEMGVIQHNGQLYAVIYPDFAFIKKENVVNIQETIKWEIIDKYNLKVPGYKKILNFTIVHNELPKTRLGKVKRFTLAELINKEKKQTQAQDKPEYQEYQILEEYLKSVAKKDILPDEHVELDLGLDSLDKVELQAHVEKTFGFSLTNEDLADHSTVRKLAAYIKEKRTKIENEAIHWGKILKEDIDFSAPKRHFMMKILKFISKPFFQFYVRVKVEGMEKIPDTPVIFAPNHQSFMDGLIIANFLSNRVLSKTYFFAKEKNVKSSFSKFFARNGNIIVMNINKDLKESLQQIAAVIKEGNNMVIFPEGARSRDGKIMSFKKTFAIISKELNVPVIPIVIDGAYDKFSIGSKFPKPGKIKLTFLDPINPEPLNYEDITQLARENIKHHLVEEEA